VQSGENVAHPKLKLAVEILYSYGVPDDSIEMVMKLVADHAIECFYKRMKQKIEEKKNENVETKPQ
jgi:hypothetical protein